MEMESKTEDSQPIAAALSPCIVWLAVGAIVGAMFVILTPPFQAPDETTHFFRAYHLSTGKVYANKYMHKKLQQELPGDLLPTSLVKVHDDYVDPKKPSLSYRFTRDQFEHASARLLDPERCGVIWLPVTALYSPVPYVPATVAIAISKYCGAKPLKMFYLGRAANLAAYLALVLLAIGVSPVHKWTMTLVALMPMSMFLAGTLSADSVTIGLAFLAIGLSLRYALSVENLGWRELVWLSLTFSLLALCKQFYVLLVLLFFLIPSRKIGGKRRYLLAALGIVALPVALNVGWLLSVQSLYTCLKPGVDPQAQLHYILGHPRQFLSAMYGIFTYLDVYRYMVGTLGLLIVTMPDGIYILYWLALIVTAYFDAGESYQVGWRIRVLSLCLVALTMVGIVTSMYLHWSLIGASFIEGVQPRYYLPVLPLFLLTLRKPNGVGRIARYIPPTAVLIAVPIASIAALRAIVIHYYW